MTEIAAEILSCLDRVPELEGVDRADIKVEKLVRFYKFKGFPISLIVLYSSPLCQVDSFPPFARDLSFLPSGYS